MHVVHRQLTVACLHVVVVVVLVSSFLFRQPPVYLPISSCVHFAHVHVNPEHQHRHEDEAPSELQVDDSHGVVQAVLAVAAQVDATVVEEAALGSHPWDPHDADDDAPQPLEREGRGPDEAHRELNLRGEPTTTAGGAEERGGEARRRGGLQEPVEPALDARVVRGVDVEHEQLLREDRRQEEHAERRVPVAVAVAVEVDGGAGVDEERGVHDGVLVVRQAFRRDGAVGVEGHRRVGQHLGGEPVDAAGEHDDELQVADSWRREPCRRDVG